MALAGELAKYIGNEMIKTGGKSALSSLVPSAVAKAGTGLVTKATLGSIIPKATSNLASDGMMTLYRGLTQKYDPKFPVAKLDTSGYESWTDNPELAKQYGDYVYSIDVPKTDIKTSYLDENPNSLTYGDRNPIYSIDKKAGLNGVKGKEYLLEVGSDYQKGLKYNLVEPDNEMSMAIQKSGVKSDVAKRAEKYLGGRMLDRTGKPVTFYHSTPNEFSKFDDKMLGSNTGYDNTKLGHFVTTDKDFSKRFIDIDNKGLTGKTMELQANIQKPITHPYMAGQKYTDPAELDKIVEDYLIATDNPEFLDELREYAAENGDTIYDEYMDMTIADSPFEVADTDREALKSKGYDAVEIVEGPKSGLVDGSKDDTPVSSYAVFEGKNLKPVRHIPVNSEKSVLQRLNVNRGNNTPLYRGISADTPENLQKYIDDMMDTSIKPKTYEGGGAYGEGYYFTPYRDSAEGYATNDLNKPYQAILEISPNNGRFIGINKYNKNRPVDFSIRAEERGVPGGRSVSVGERDFDNYLSRNGILGNKASENVYVVKDNSALNGMKIVGRRGPGEEWDYTEKLLSNKIKETGADKYLPKAPTQIKFNKDLSIRKTGGNFGHKGVKGMRGGSAPKIQQSIDVRSSLINKAKNYKSLERFEKMNNPIKGSEIWGEKPTSIFQRDSRAVRINMFPNEAVKGTGITKQYLLNLLKDAYDQGITDIVPSYGSYTKEGASFMDHLAEQGWVKATGKNGWSSYEISPKIAEWEKTDPLADIYNEAHNNP